MATLATVLDKLFENQIDRAGSAAHRDAASAAVRPFANEDIFFLRQADR